MSRDLQTRQSSDSRQLPMCRIRLVFAALAAGKVMKSWQICQVRLLESGILGRGDEQSRAAVMVRTRVRINETARDKERIEAGTECPRDSELLRRRAVARDLGVAGQTVCQ